MSHTQVQLPRKEQRGSSSRVFHREWRDKCSKPEFLRGKRAGRAREGRNCGGKAVSHFLGDTGSQIQGTVTWLGHQLKKG